jgi:hypothetical protein
MRLSPSVLTIAVATLMFSVAVVFVVSPVDPLAVLYRAAVFAAACAAILWATNSSSAVEAFRWFSVHRVTASYLFVFTLVMAVWFLYGGVGIARVVVETVHAFFFFWACAVIGERYFGRQR